MKKLFLTGALLCAFSLSALAASEVDIHQPTAALADGSTAVKVISVKTDGTVNTGSAGSGGDASAANQTTQITAEQAVLAALNARLGVGAAHVASSHVTASTTAGTLAIARATRRTCLFRNLDASINVWIGPATVTSGTGGNGTILKPGESIPVTAVTLWQVIAESGTPIVSVADEYD